MDFMNRPKVIDLTKYEAIHSLILHLVFNEPNTKFTLDADFCGTFFEDIQTKRQLIFKILPPDSAYIYLNNIAVYRFPANNKVVGIYATFETPYMDKLLNIGVFFDMKFTSVDGELSNLTIYVRRTDTAITEATL